MSGRYINYADEKSIVQSNVKAEFLNVRHKFFVISISSCDIKS